MIFNYKMMFYFVGIAILTTSLPKAHADSTTSPWSSEMTVDTTKQQGCNEVVAKNISDSQSAQIKGSQEVANGLLDKVLGNMSYRSASCLDNLLNMYSNPTSSFGAGTNLSSLLANAACSYSQKMLGPTISDYNSAVSSGKSFLTNSMQIPNVAGLNFGTVMGFQNSTLNATGQLSNIYKQNVSGWNSSGNVSTKQIINSSNILGLSLNK